MSIYFFINMNHYVRSVYVGRWNIEKITEIIVRISKISLFSSKYPDFYEFILIIFEFIFSMNKIKFKSRCLCKKQNMR